MADSKKYNGSTWEHSLRKLATATDTFTTLPVDVYADGNNATVGITGNTVQNGTPTPDNPVMPQGTGERTGNKWNAEGFSARVITSTHEHTSTNSYGTTISSTTGKEVSVTQADYPTGNVGYQNGFFFLDVDFSKYSIGDVITLSFDYIVDDVHALSTQMSTILYAGKNNNPIAPTLSSGDWKISGRLTATITIISDMSPYVEVRLCGNSITVKNIMLNTGSTALPYEPYGYKIPILSASTTTPVYLGEVETTRRIKKVILTGNEQVYGVEVPSTNTMIFNFENLLNTAQFIPTVASLSTHYVYNPIQSGMVAGLPINQYALQYYAPETKYNLLIHDSIYKSASAFQAYLQQQYANGTPVTVWYVLVEPKTGTVNEPLMKIGDYADTVSGISIPTIAGENSFDVLTTLKPSEATVNYKGWHPVQSVHEKSKNLFDYSTVTIGKYISASGEEETSSGTGEQSLNHSDYITVNAGMTYTFKCDKSLIESATFNAFCWFDSNKQFIKRATFDVGAVDPYILGTATAPTGTAYLIMNYRGLHGDTAMLNEGSTALPYESYWE